jgi:hypothetical protein
MSQTRRRRYIVEDGYHRPVEAAERPGPLTVFAKSAEGWGVMPNRSSWAVSSAR